MTVSVSPHSPAPWVQPNGQPVPAFFQFQVKLARNISAAGSVSVPTGGTVIDVQARAAIAAIISALGQS